MKTEPGLRGSGKEAGEDVRGRKIYKLYVLVTHIQRASKSRQN